MQTGHECCAWYLSEQSGGPGIALAMQHQVMEATLLELCSTRRQLLCKACKQGACTPQMQTRSGNTGMVIHRICSALPAELSCTGCDGNSFARLAQVCAHAKPAKVSSYEPLHFLSLRVGRCPKLKNTSVDGALVR